MSKRILIVDDDPMFRRFAEVCLQELGLDCRSAASLEEAKQAIEDFDPYCVVLDCHLDYPKQGLELLPWLTAHAPHVPVVMVSADDAWDLAAETLEQGAFVFWRKSAGANGLIEATVSALREHRLRMRGAATPQLCGIDREEILAMHQNNTRHLSYSARAITHAMDVMVAMAHHDHEYA